MRKWQSKEVFGCEWHSGKSKALFIQLFFLKFELFRQVLNIQNDIWETHKRIERKQGFVS